MIVLPNKTTLYYILNFKSLFYFLPSAVYVCHKVLSLDHPTSFCIVATLNNLFALLVIHIGAFSSGKSLEHVLKLSRIDLAIVVHVKEVNSILDLGCVCILVYVFLYVIYEVGNGYKLFTLRQITIRIFNKFRLYFLHFLVSQVI